MTWRRTIRNQIMTIVSPIQATSETRYSSWNVEIIIIQNLTDFIAFLCYREADGEKWLPYEIWLESFVRRRKAEKSNQWTIEIHQIFTYLSDLSRSCNGSNAVYIRCSGIGSRVVRGSGWKGSDFEEWINIYLTIAVITKEKHWHWHVFPASTFGHRRTNARSS